LKIYFYGDKIDTIQALIITYPKSMKKNFSFSEGSKELSILDLLRLNLLAVKLSKDKKVFTKLPVYFQGALMPIIEN